ncbi:MAG: class I SAM-dependent methyltransferase [Deltaproteobacteria bacterium]|nr:class I SAM-dependent methyltransferase [Deltaproteobacteria bacterium]
MSKTILELINRTPEPAPWSEGDNIPWDDPEFSERMLVEHLSQEHDLASRRNETIDLHVEWIFSQVLDSRPARVLDLACGPGFYANRLARNGCTCVGMDFSPASIRYAKETAAAEALPCTYHHADVREGLFGEGFDLSMMIYGQFNVFPRNLGLEILKNACSAMKPGGHIVLEVQTNEQIRKSGQSPPTWHSARSGLFSGAPHLVMQESFWHEDTQSSTVRFMVIEGQSGRASTYALSNEAYTEREITDAIELAGFTHARWFPSLNGKPAAGEQDLPVIVARK